MSSRWINVQGRSRLKRRRSPNSDEEGERQETASSSSFLEREFRDADQNTFSVEDAVARTSGKESSSGSTRTFSGHGSSRYSAAAAPLIPLGQNSNRSRSSAGAITAVTSGRYGAHVPAANRSYIVPSDDEEDARAFFAEIENFEREHTGGQIADHAAAARSASNNGPDRSVSSLGSEDGVAHLATHLYLVEEQNLEAADVSGGTRSPSAASESSSTTVPLLESDEDVEVVDLSSTPARHHRNRPRRQEGRGVDVISLDDQSQESPSVIAVRRLYSSPQALPNVSQGWTTARQVVASTRGSSGGRAAVAQNGTRAGPRHTGSTLTEDERLARRLQDEEQSRAALEFLHHTVDPTEDSDLYMAIEASLGRLSTPSQGHGRGPQGRGRGRVTSGYARERGARGARGRGRGRLGSPGFRYPNGYIPASLTGRLPQSLLMAGDRDFTPEDYEMLLQLDEQSPKVTGADEILISTLPIHTISEAEMAKSAAEDRTCCICMDDMGVGQRVRRLPCFHKFHVDCIDSWLRVNKVCPIDKKPVDASF